MHPVWTCLHNLSWADQEIDKVMRLLCTRIVSARRRVSHLTAGAEYKNSVFHAAAAPLRLYLSLLPGVYIVFVELNGCTVMSLN